MFELPAEVGRLTRSAGLAPRAPAAAASMRRRWISAAKRHIVALGNQSRLVMQIALAGLVQTGLRVVASAFSARRKAHRFVREDPDHVQFGLGASGNDENAFDTSCSSAGLAGNFRAAQRGPVLRQQGQRSTWELHADRYVASRSRVDGSKVTVVGHAQRRRWRTAACVPQGFSAMGGEQLRAASSYESRRDRVGDQRGGNHAAIFANWRRSPASIGCRQ